MAKNKTAKELGIPSEYRLSQSNCENILKVALRHKFKDEVLRLAWKEVDLIQCISNIAYSNKDIDQYVDVIKKLNNDGANKYPMQLVTKVEMQPGGNKVILGSGSGWHRDDENKGIISNDIFGDIIDNIHEKEFFVRNPDNYDTTHEFKWIQEYIVMREPNYGHAKLSGYDLWTVIGSGLRKKVNQHIQKCDKLKAKIYKVETLIKSILATYTSTIKLCNDSPEFINYINDAMVYNKHGKKCTDVSTADMVQELSKL